MTTREAARRLDAFLESGHAGQVVLNVAPGQNGRRSTIASIEIHERLTIARGEQDDEILDRIASARVMSR